MKPEKKVEKQFEVFRKNIHELRNCDQLLYARQQVLFTSDTKSPLLSLIYSNVKSYRTALFAPQLNLMNSIASLLSQYVPMLLLPKESFEIILELVGDLQEKSMNRFNLAIPKQKCLSYFESKQLLDVLTPDDGLIMTMSIPVAARQSAFTVYKAKLEPLPQVKENTLTQCRVESEYLAF